ncbi:cytochrome P450 [Pestalotiopsis sp. NC0098]|nr:cytochrome P450 [Pestalotiopsis sp. NC0098]
MAMPELPDNLLEAAGAQLTTQNALFVLGLWLGYRVAVALWNVSPLHPLSRIPGPKMAAASYLPEFYYDAVKFGRYTQQIKKMHAKYGPIVRISPDEVHCADNAFIDEIYAVGGRKRDKFRHQVSGSAMEFSGFATYDHDLHRMRRGPLAKFFARGQVAKLEPSLQDLVQRLCDKLLQESGRCKPIDVTMAYSCFTSDAIADYAFGESFGFLAQDEWEPNYRASLYAFLQTVYIFRFFPFLKHATLAAPWLTKYMSDGMALLIKTLQTDIPAQVKSTKEDYKAHTVNDRPNVFGSLLESDMPEHEKSIVRLSDEASAVLSAGTETTSWTVSVITYHVLTQPKILSKLTEELNSVVKDPKKLPTWTDLEKLPYLGAVIQEGLRLSYGVSARTSRVPTEEDLLYRGQWTPQGSEKPVNVEYVIPRGYAIGMSTAISHHDESVWPDSHSFVPERWFDENMERNRDLEKQMLSFSRGSRACIGMNLAFCELHLLVAALTLRVWPKMRLFETTVRDVQYDHDMFIPLSYDGSKGVRVTME